MRCFTSQRPGLWVLIVSLFSCFFRVPFSCFCSCFFPVVYPLLLHCLWMVFFWCCLLFFPVYHALFDVLLYFSNPGFPIATEHVCKAFLQALLFWTLHLAKRCRCNNVARSRWVNTAHLIYIRPSLLDLFDGSWRYMPMVSYPISIYFDPFRSFRVCLR